MTRSIHLSLILVVLIIVGLTVSAPYMTRAQEDETQADDAESIDAAQQLKTTLENVGISPSNPDASGETPALDAAGVFDWISAPFTKGEASSDKPHVDEEVVTDDAVEEANDVPNPTTSVAGASVPSSDQALDDVRLPELPESLQPTAITLPTLDELLRRARRGTISQEERMLSQLTKREAIAEAMKRTLDVAAGVAIHGEAAIQLLESDELETVITTLITQYENDQAAASDGSDPAATVVEPLIAAPSSINEDPNMSFNEYTAVYSRQHKGIVEVGMRQQRSGEIAVLRIDEVWYVGDDVVVLKQVVPSPTSTTLMFELNGERIDVSL